jgi:DNA-binding NtrC family response regulator
MALEEVEREYTRAVLASFNGHRGEPAAILGVDRKTLTRKLEDPGLISGCPERRLCFQRYRR